MLVESDTSAFWATVNEVDARLARLNVDSSLDGFVALFSRLVSDLPSDFFETEVVPAAANEVYPVLAVLRPGPRLNAIAAAVRAFDFNVHLDPSPLRVA